MTHAGYPLISVVVCTYNRAALLQAALESLCSQTADRSAFEVIVVDNNSSDTTRSIVNGFMQYNNIRMVSESRQGLSHARNRGWREARGSYVAYIDDDARAPETWISCALERISISRPAVFGGPYYPFYTTKKPRWFKDAYASQSMGEQAMKIAGPGLSGGNMFIKRELLERTGGFDPGLGMVAGKQGYGEETALLKHISEAMPDQPVYYDPQIFVYHLVKPCRMTLRWNLVHFFLSGRYALRALQTDGMTAPARKSIILRDMCSVLFDLCADILRALFFRNRTGYPLIRNCIYECCLPHLRRLGWLFEQFRRTGENTHG